MRSRIRLINVCIRHKCTDGIRTFKKTQWKKVRLKNCRDVEESNEESLTSKSAKSVTGSIYNSSVIPVNFEVGFHKLLARSTEVDASSKLNVNIRQISKKSMKEQNVNSGTESKNVKIHDSNEQVEVKSDQQLNRNDIQEPKKLENNSNVDLKINPKRDNVRVNEVNMQMLPEALHNQLFRKDNKDDCLSEEEINDIKKNLATYGINVEDATRLPDVNLKLPALEGNDIEEHFYNIGKAQIKPYLQIIHETVRDIPEMPKQWLFKEGWTRYAVDGTTESVDYPLEDGVIFDIEVCMKQGPLPTLATAVSNKAWYGWVSSSLTQGIDQTFDMQLFTPSMLVPMESSKEEHGYKLNQHQRKPKIVVGHNVSYDRSRIKEQYWLNCTGTRFLDTMSLHVCNSGFNSYQRSLLLSKKANAEREIWQTNTSLNSLVEVHKLYCGYEIKKEARNLFVEGTIEDVRDNFDMLMSYCASDVVATHNILRKLFPLFQERFPHPVTLAGMLELGSVYLPINSNWQRYLEESESTFDDLNYEAKFILAKRADVVCRLMHDEKYKEDLWMWDQDWSTQKIKMKSKVSVKERKLADVETNVGETKEQSDAKYLSDDEEEEENPLKKEFAYLEETRRLLPARMPHMPGYPAWYRKLCLKQSDEDWAPGPQNISTSMQVVPKLLNLTWEKYPLHYIREHGWGILVPYNDDPDIETKLPLRNLLAQCPLPASSSSRDVSDDAMATLNTDVQNDLHKTEFWRFKKKKQDEASYNETYRGTGVWCNVDIDNCCYFFKLPHKDGTNYNVGNPLAKDFLNKFSENVLAGLDVSAAEVLKIARMLSYWRNNRDRIMSQLVIWLDEHSLPGVVKRAKRHARYGAIVPQVVVSGTLTRRAVEPTWMTASNAHAERIGSELRCMVQAPPGYNIVGADVDSQELWIASIIGDAHYKRVHGATPFGWMTLIGTKSNGTDMHSVTAKAIGISRDHAKVINYARIYGAGQKFAERLLKQFNPSMTDAEANSKSRKMFALTKGKKTYRLKTEIINDDLQDIPYPFSQACRIAKLHGKGLQDIFQKSEWMGGSESAMFNRLEQIAGSEHPITPFLNARLSRALEITNTDEDDKFLPTKINWVVQSGAVDFLHLMLVSMRWLMKDNARFCLSFHDEVRYLVPSRYKYNAALAMHVTNLLTRSFCASKLGMRDLPMSVAFFAAVEVDTVFRKEATDDCKTPSNPHGLQNGYEVPPGESLDVWAALEKSGGSLGSWRDTKSRKVKSDANSTIEKSPRFFKKLVKRKL
ncbi:DNA polymerase subunit gamma-1, mitochondrial [Monomorium pharaonis]|uniref:DNA polymerase subunit gamma-1, mitochondrial n=1 Tax=Monomorium pharaonis TaxID=307658 RepID=UPI00063F9876|nr:DNA polymerase subunit gamma-1, mitochondrial [Monomorium pharaonis]